VTRWSEQLRPLLVPALRIAVAAMLVGSVFVQAFIVPLLAIDLKEADADVAHLQVPVAVILILGIVSIQVTLICVWRLLTMVAHGTVFSAAAFRYVDTIIGAASVAALLGMLLGFVLAPGEAVAPGVVLLIGGGSVAAGGVGLLVFVLRTLLAQAISRDAEAKVLQAELDEVI
jgi:hypothetical protein